MRRTLLAIAASSTMLIGSGCYHATVETGATPSAQVISKEFAAGWLYGLVPPSTVETASKCPHGVAKVETQVSFVNGLVAFLTFEIYTPMTIEVTCASATTADAAPVSSDMTVSRVQGIDAVEGAFASAASQAASTHRAVFVEVK